MVARGADGETRAFPVVETVHRDSICWVTETPAAVPAGTLAAVAQMAEGAVKALAGDTANLHCSGPPSLCDGV